MTFAPNTIVLYVDDITSSSRFYTDTLRIQPIEASPTFHVFKLSTGMNLGLKVTSTVEPQVTHKNNSELAFTVSSHTEVDEVYAKWKDRGVSMLMQPTMLTYGYAFVARDLDGNRLRVVALKNT